MAAKKEIKIETPNGNYFYACGKRKTAIAKVRFYPKGENKRYDTSYKTSTQLGLF